MLKIHWRVGLGLGLGLGRRQAAQVQSRGRMMKWLSKSVSEWIRPCIKRKDVGISYGEALSFKSPPKPVISERRSFVGPAKPCHPSSMPSIIHTIPTSESNATLQSLYRHSRRSVIMHTIRRNVTSCLQPRTKIRCLVHEAKAREGIVNDPMQVISEGQCPHTLSTLYATAAIRYPPSAWAA